jgi:hypothetical protein
MPKAGERACLEEFKAFKEYLQYERKRMAQQIIDLTDTEAFAELKSVYDAQRTRCAFEQKIAPFTDIVDAVYTLDERPHVRRVQNHPRQGSRGQARRCAPSRSSTSKLSTEITASRAQRRARREQGVLRHGRTKKASREEIAKNGVILEQKKAELADLTGRIKRSRLAA